jgi:uncharacterized oxidoreductase
MTYQNRTILITGGATGIGLALAERFVRANNKVIVCGRREAALAEARARVPGLHTLPADVSNAQERVALFERVTREHPELDILINNAGVQNHPPPLTQAQDWSQHAHEIETNLGAPMHLAMLFLPHLLSRPEAAILNVSSGLAFTPIARIATYCATKAALHSFTLSLRAALTGTRVSVVEIIPPAVNTELGGAGVHANAEPLDPYADDVMKRLIAGELEFGYKSSEERRNASRAELDRRYAMANGLALGSPMKRQLTTPTARE